MNTPRPPSASLCLLVGVALLLASPSAFAYLDPSTGSMIISAIVGIFASLALALKTYWYSIKSFFRSDSKTETPPKDPSE